MNFRTAAALVCLGGLSVPAFATIWTFDAQLSGLSESPPNASPGTGFTIVTIDDQTRSMRVQAVFSLLMGPTTAAHIHVRPNLQTPNGGVATQVPTFAGFPTGVTQGTYDTTFDMNQAASWNGTYITNNGGTTQSAFTAFLTAMQEGRTYFNIHTSVIPSGELRGDLQAVPEPATLAALGIGALALIRRRKR